MVFVYALLTWWQGCSTNRLVTISQNQQRPYLWAVPKFKEPAPGIFRKIIGTDRTEIDMDVEIRNGGPSPAVNVLISNPIITMSPTRFWDMVLKDNPPMYGTKDQGSIVARIPPPELKLDLLNMPMST